MGGGDLNLKKSWHPHTMKNQEKVWKAEQAKNAEDRKMSDLRKEIMEEKNREELVKIGQTSGVLAKSDDKKLEWMYKSSTELINREDYLLGRPIDKAFETLAAEEKQRDKDLVGVKVPVNHVEHECIPFSIRAYRNATSTEQVDLQRKILEDPLMMIKQKEMESRRKILENPVKLKELHRILKTEKSNKTKSSSHAKKSKKSKKSKKKQRQSGSDASVDSDKDLDEMLQKQYKKLKGSLDKDNKQLAGLDLSKLLDAKYETISKELDKAAQSKKKKGKSKKKSKNHSSSSSDSESNNERIEHRNRRNGDDYIAPRSFRDRSRSPVYRGDQRRDRSRSPFDRRDQRRDGSRSPVDRRDQRRDRSRSPVERRDQRRDRSRSPVERRDQRRDKDRCPPSERRNWNAGDRSRNYPSNNHNDHSFRKRSQSRSPRRRNNTYRRSKSPPKSKYSQSSTSRDAREESSKKPAQKERLTEEEKEKRLKDMMENAAWRDKERTRYVQNYRDGYRQEEEQNKARDFDKEFINTQLRKAISTQNSVESRIRSNVNNIQRTSAAMNANFAKK